MAIATVDQELRVLHGMVKDTFGSRAGTQRATRPQVLAIILALKDYYPVRENRLWALGKLLPREYGRVRSTNDLDKATASVLINWLYATQDGLDENTTLSAHARRVLEDLE